jgi:hypothetical protein
MWVGDYSCTGQVATIRQSGGLGTTMDGAGLGQNT